MIDYEKRKRIMGRSIKLGHCICNPKDPCPCELFQQKNVCLCAGEREEDAAEDTPLTQLVENAGCASKISQADLKAALAGLPRVSDPSVLISSDTCDDAGVYKLNERLALVQSVDVFTPCVDDAYLFGQIAAANSVSDIYAMGGRPLTALSVAAFPVEKLSLRVMNRMLQGGISKIKEAGAVVIGGHSIKDKEVKFGFAVTGVVHPRKIVTNAGARVGDALILTKPIGTGALCFAAQLGKAAPSLLAEAGRSMAELNKAAAEIMVEAGVSAATDVTGFGLAGHLSELACQSGVTVEIDLAAVPVFDGVLDCFRSGLISGAVERNREYASGFITKDGELGEELEAVLYDPQTSGGLLLSVVSSRSSALLRELKRRGARRAAAIGRVVAASEGKIILTRGPGRSRPKRYA
jgi:selenide,water dikinase